MDGESLTILISAVCSAGGEQKVYARKECARALGVVASAICPSRAAALQQPALGRILAHLKKLVGDADSSVREAAAEALGLVARGLSEAGGSLASLIKLLADCLAEGKKEAQAGACAALALVGAGEAHGWRHAAGPGGRRRAPLGHPLSRLSRF
jgi:hypothetical protein